ncbi:MAG TPA: hypothetical protein VHE37_05745, partial [Nevskiaceae bacterium]|nr:hypothetical protein [Nevskiaceae bacterium]
MKAKTPFELVAADPVTIRGPLRFGCELKGKKATSFVMREATTDDVLAAEADAHAVNTPLTYEVALAARQLVSIGDFEGPFTLGVLREKLSKPADIQRLRMAQVEIDRLVGEG